MTWTPTTLTIKDANGVSQPVTAYTDGTNFSFAHPVLDNTGAVIAPATSGKQDAGNASLADIDANLGAKADAAASTDAGTFSLIALVKRALGTLGSIFSSLTSAQGTTPVPADTTVAAGNYFVVNASAAGTVNVTFANGTTGSYPVKPGLTVFRIGVTRVSSGSTATATYENWK